MSYSIRYGPDSQQEILANRKPLNLWIARMLIVILTLTGIVWPKGREVLHQLLFPWVNEVTTAAFGQMISRISSGVSVPVSFFEFCKEVIGRAWIPV